MRIYQYRDMTDIEAFVLASEQERAAELFERHLRAHGGDPDALMFRELQEAHLNGPERSAVLQALDFDHEGLVSSDAGGQWVFLVPLAVGEQADEPAG
jgi:hypothetical protein